MNTWLLLSGLVLLGVALTGSYVRRLPLSAAMIYLAVGIAIGAPAVRLIHPSLPGNAALIQHIVELAIIISLFGAGLKLRLPLRNAHWLIPVRLAFLSMVVTVAAIALVGAMAFHLPLGAAIFLGAILAPTDPVLAADVQVERPFSYNEVRFGLTGEAGLNDGTAIPFALLGLGFLGLHDLGAGGWRWLAVDFVWKTAGGFAIGSVLGFSVARFVLHLRRGHREALGLDDFLALGLIALSYSCAEFAHANGFLAVFAAGLGLRRQERRETGRDSPEEAASEINLTPGWREQVATSPKLAPVYMAQSLLNFNQHLENIGELIVVVLVGGLLWRAPSMFSYLWFAVLLLIVIRPVSVLLGLAGTNSGRVERRLMSWFGVRGIGSVYYLCFGITHGLPAEVAEICAAATFTVIAVSILAHGITVSPVMNWYSGRSESDHSTRVATNVPS